MTPHQQKALIAYRDRGVTIDTGTRNRLIRDGHLSVDGVIITTRPEDIDTRTQGEKVADLFKQGKSTKRIAKLLGLTERKVLVMRHRVGITGTPTNKPFSLKNAMIKHQISVGHGYDFLAAHPDIEAIFALAARERLTLLEAAGRLLRGNEEPHPVFRRSLRL